MAAVNEERARTLVMRVFAFMKRKGVHAAFQPPNKQAREGKI